MTHTKRFQHNLLRLRALVMPTVVSAKQGQFRSSFWHTSTPIWMAGIQRSRTASQRIMRSCCLTMRALELREEPKLWEECLDGQQSRIKESACAGSIQYAVQ